MESQNGENLRPRPMKPPNLPPLLDHGPDDSADLNELRCVLDTLEAIQDITQEIVRESAPASKASSTLGRVFELSKGLPKILLPFPGSTIPKFKVCLETYELILIDVRDRLNAGHEAAGSCDVISRRLDLFVDDLEEKVHQVHAAVGRVHEPLLPGSPSMFQNSRNFAIFGGNFNAIQVVPDSDQSHKILRILYFQCGFLFV
ncbi:hypothetical protein M413DRAFT_271170 [Hebeloma cylindrosporum]|uniref:Uncharacterized protein n=1 Tax=Hebeloma cylindrosporum TaxID=76867 RepID=A0A0C3CEL3_HEBCY|nr:hypothetical protein M413DRAFT_271170 [Hebeloma cylindrosporum h7]